MNLNTQDTTPETFLRSTVAECIEPHASDHSERSARRKGRVEFL